MIPPPDPVIDAMAAEWVRTTPPLTEEQIHRIAILLSLVEQPRAEFDTAAA